MYIFNIRQGFATNSSSSHSILELKKENIKNITENEMYSFGWEFFTASDEESKENYLSTMIAIGLRDIGFQKNKIKKYINDLFKNEKMHDRTTKVDIDHQSIITFPRNWDNNQLNEEFLKDMIEYFKKENVVILGVMIILKKTIHYGIKKIEIA